MPCWVAPTLAAEIWQIPLDALMSRIASGEVPVRDEDGFLFVDVAPYGPRLERPNRAPQDRPATFTPITAGVVAEHPADPDDSPLMVSDEEAVALLPSPALARTYDDEMGPEDETASQTLGDWRVARRKAARTRIPPPRSRRLSA